MRICSIPALLLMSSFIGFAGLAIESGITVVQAVFMTLTIWALPAKVVLIGAISAGVALPAAALAVGLSSVRLMPMVVALLPELQGPKTRKLTLAALCHFVAVTAWVMAMEELRKIPRDMRTSYFAGIGMVLVGNQCDHRRNRLFVIDVFSTNRFCGTFHADADVFSDIALAFSQGERAGQVAMVCGIALFPIFHHLAPGYDLLITGILGGLIAFGFHRMRQIPAGAGE